MHELGLTRCIVSIVAEHAGSRRVRRVRLAVGPHTCVEREALGFYFDIVARDSVLAGATLEFLEAEGSTFLIQDYEIEEAA